VIVKRPNLYFVLDASGSMAEPLPGDTRTKYYGTQVAVRDVLVEIGHRVNFGAAAFPAAVNPDGCAAGEEVFETAPGDPKEANADGDFGPNLYALLQTLSRVKPQGGTPTAITLDALRAKLALLPGTTTVVLATDGAPNCNGSLLCDANHCQFNIERNMVDGHDCTPDFNCCDASLSPNAPYYCVDDDATVQAVDALAKAGIKTYVIGMPGSEHYADLLDRVAVTGQTARAGSPRYYAVADVAQLSAAVRQIGVEVAASCLIELDQPPPDPARVNVYFDTTLLRSGPENGWVWISDRALELRGSACADLKSGNIQQVQVVSGCPTMVF